jgi:hypothetical protein
MIAGAVIVARHITTTSVLSDIREPVTDNQLGFATAVEGFANGRDALSKYPEIAHWLATRKT